MKLDDKKRLILDSDNWGLIAHINMLCNQSIKYKTDMELYNKSDFWTIADKEGDCDDYSVTKKHKLLALGYPFDCLKLATCWVEGPTGPGTGGYHAVLIVDTDRGSFVLDNRHTHVNNYKDLPYKWHKIEVPGKPLWKEIKS